MHSGSTVASKNLAIREDVVRRLDQAKRPGESYSDVIARHLDEKPTLDAALAYARAHPSTGKDTLTPRLREIRRQTDESFEARRKRFEAMP